MLYVTFHKSDGCVESHSDESDESVTIGPFEWVELTYDRLRIAPNGDVIAFYTCCWLREEDGKHYSDVVIASP